MQRFFFCFLALVCGCEPSESDEATSAGSGGSGGAGGAPITVESCEPMPERCVVGPPTPAPPCAMAYPDVSLRPWVCDAGATLDECLPTEFSVTCQGESDARILRCCP